MAATASQPRVGPLKRLNHRMNQVLNSNRHLLEVDKKVRKFLAKNPPTPGHGYLHLLNTAFKAYRLAKENSYPEETAFVSGLLHDIYRPSEGKAGKEEHGKTAAGIAAAVLKETSWEKDVPKITKAIGNHDNPNLKEPLDQILFLADVEDITLERGVAYAFSSNLWAKEHNRPLPYTNALRLLCDWQIWQEGKWEILYRINLLGKEKAIAAMVKMTKNAFKLYQSALAGTVSYKALERKLTLNEMSQNEKILRQTGTPREEIKKILRNYLKNLK